MGEELKHKSWDDYGWGRFNKKHIRYPWHRWLNGSMWLLVLGQDFDGDSKEDTERFRKYVYQYAKGHGIKVKTKIAENRRDLFIKAVKNTTTDGLRRSKFFREYGRQHQRLHGLDDYPYEYPEAFDGPEE